MLGVQERAQREYELLVLLRRVLLGAACHRPPDYPLRNQILREALIEKMRGVVPLLPDVVGLLVEGRREVLAEVPQQVLEDHFIAQVRVLQLLQFEFHKSHFLGML